MNNDKHQKLARGSASILQRLVMHSFNDSNGRRWVACCECTRGGNGNNADKCACGWKCTTWNQGGCFLGSEIVGEVKPPKKVSRSKQRYQRFLEYGDSFDSFIDFCRWDAAKEHDWNAV